MTTQPPSPEAVEAALHYSDWQPSSVSQIAAIQAYCGRTMKRGTACLIILAAEVQRLRDITKRQAIDICAYVAEVAELRGKADAVCEWIPGTDEWSTRCEASYSGEFWGHMYCVYCPNCGRKVKIQPQANEDQ